MDEKKSFDRTQDKEVDMNPEKQEKRPEGLTRREFLRRAGAAALGTVAGVLLPDLRKEAL